MRQIAIWIIILVMCSALSCGTTAMLHKCPEQVEIKELDIQRMIECSGGSVSELQKYIRGAGLDIVDDDIFGPLTLAGWMITKNGIILYEETP